MTLGKRSDGESTRLVAQGLSLGYGKELVVRDVDVHIPDGKITVIVGANACGKSTLLRGLARLLEPSSGTVLLDGRQIHKQSTVEVARELGLLPQSPAAPDGITVADLVSRGRYPHQQWFRRWTTVDETAVQRALDATGMGNLVARRLQDLSGGQRQRAWIAMVLAQETGLLLLDEPTTFLDITHQIELLDLLVDLNAERGTTIIAVLHDLNLSFRYADHLIAMKSGLICAEGPPESVATAELVDEVFNLKCEVLPDPIAGTPMVVPYGRHRVRSASGSRAAPASRNPAGQTRTPAV